MGFLDNPLGSVQDTLFGKDRSGQAEFNPYGVSTGLGSVTWKGNNATFNLADSYKNWQNTLFGKAGDYLNGNDSMSKAGYNIFSGSQGLLDRALAYDTEASAGNMYSRMSAMARPGEERQTAGLENKLFSRGMLGSTGGANMMAANNEALYSADLQRQLSARGQALTEQNSLLGNAMSAMGTGQNLLTGANALGLGLFGAGAGIDQQALQQILAGAQIGGMKASAGANAAQIGMAHDSALTDMLGGLAGAYVSSMSGKAGK